MCLLFLASTDYHPADIHSYSPLGQFIRQLLGNAFDVRAQSGTGISSFPQAQIPESANNTSNFPALPETETKKEEATLVVSESNSSSDPIEPEPKQQRPNTPDSASMADAEQSPAAPAAENDVQEDEDKEYVPSLPARRSYKYDDPPIIFRDVDVSVVKNLIFIF